MEVKLSKSLTLLIGARSAVSHFARELAQRLGGPVLLVTTIPAGDEEVEKNRPSVPNTFEVKTQLAKEIKKGIGGAGVVIIDCLTILISNIFSQYTDQTGELSDSTPLKNRLNAEIKELIEEIKQLDVHFIIISNEVGLETPPLSSLAQLYREELAQANQRLAEVADRVYLMVAGLPFLVKPPPA